MGPQMFTFWQRWPRSRWARSSAGGIDPQVWLIRCLVAVSLGTSMAISCWLRPAQAGTAPIRVVSTGVSR